MTKEGINCLVGRNIRQVRTSRNMTVDELADVLEITSGYIGLLERGKRGATAFNLHRLSEALSEHTRTFSRYVCLNIHNSPQHESSKSWRTSKKESFFIIILMEI